MTAVKKSQARTFTNIGGDKIADKLFHIVVDRTTLLNSSHNCGEIVISENHFWRWFGNSRSTAHGNTDLGLPQRGCIIYTVTSLLMFTRYKTKPGYCRENPIWRSHRKSTNEIVYVQKKAFGYGTLIKIAYADFWVNDAPRAKGYAPEDRKPEAYTQGLMGKSTNRTHQWLICQI